MPPCEEGNRSSRILRAHPYAPHTAQPPLAQGALAPQAPQPGSVAVEGGPDNAQSADATAGVTEPAAAASDRTPAADASVAERRLESCILYLNPMSLDYLSAIQLCESGENPMQYLLHHHDLKAWITRMPDLDKNFATEKPMYAYDIMLVWCNKCQSWRRWENYAPSRQVVLKRRLEVLGMPLNHPYIQGVDQVACSICGDDDMPADTLEARREVLEAIRNHEVEMEIDIGVRMTKVGVRRDVSFRIGVMLDDMAPAPWQNVMWTSREALSMCRRLGCDVVNRTLDETVTPLPSSFRQPPE